MVGPVSTIVLADLLLDERMGLTQVAGTVLVMVGVFIVSQGRAQEVRRAPRDDRSFVEPMAQESQP